MRRARPGPRCRPRVLLTDEITVALAADDVLDLLDRLRGDSLAVIATTTTPRSPPASCWYATVDS